MKIAFDVDGVLTEHPVFFSAVTHALRSAGHEVHVLSDFDVTFREQRIRELERMGIDFDHFEIAAKKDEYCAAHGIAYALDDEAHDYYPGRGASVLSIVEIQ